MTSLPDRFSLALAPTSDVQAACAAFQDILPELGYASVDYASGPITRWPMQDNLDWRPDVVYATFNWAELYFGTDFQKHDRILPHMLRQTTPWLYWDVWGTPTDDPVARQLDELAQSRIRSGLSIPFHGPGLRFAGVNLGSQLEREDLASRDRETRATVFLLASMLHQHIQEITRKAGPAPTLSDRQTQCLMWAARGKTAWETARILAISESAVKKHLAAAAKLLDARNSVHAVAIALSGGLISR